MMNVFIARSEMIQEEFKAVNDLQKEVAKERFALRQKELVLRRQNVESEKDEDLEPDAEEIMNEIIKKLLNRTCEEKYEHF